MAAEPKIPYSVFFRNTTGPDLVNKLDQLRQSGFAPDSTHEALGSANFSIDPDTEAAFLQRVNGLGGSAHPQRVFRAV